MKGLNAYIILRGAEGVNAYICLRGDEGLISARVH